MAAKMTSVSFWIILLVVVVSQSSADTRCTSKEMVKINFSKLAVANNDLAFNLLRKLNTESKNVFFSPFGISMALGMLLHGSGGDTAEELRNVLGYQKVNLSDEAVHDTFYCFLTEVFKGSGFSDEYILNYANAVLLDKNVELFPEYKNNVQDSYKALVRKVDFANDSVEIVHEINDWVKEKTNGKIKKFLKELNPSAIMVLLNTVYFKNIWKVQFNPEFTFSQPFYNHGLKTEKKYVTTMNMIGGFHNADFEDFKALELLYKGENISMLILFPNHCDGLRDLEESLTADKLFLIQYQLRYSHSFFSLPKFKIRFEKDLSSAIKALGANSIFNASAANFSGMTPSNSVFVDQVLHKTVMKVNEKGSEAADRSGDRQALPFKMRLDHPFLFAIIQKLSRRDMVLFLGHVNKL
ncbi:serpin B8 [Trichonephila clavata]|uniref:Serpin B8 n=1 Tax=Trichonephila clavata TaxID=2740835 RepID=A0A8X6HHG9_TRICU|nr:serpin B8 [Trichonephila clavata]